MSEEAVRQRRIREANEAEAARAVPPPNPSVQKLEIRIGHLRQQLRLPNLSLAERGQFEEAMTKAETTLAEIKGALGQQNATISAWQNRVTELEQRETAMQQQSAHLGELESRMQQRSAALDAREQGLAQREEALAAREKEIAAREAIG